MQTHSNRQVANQMKPFSPQLYEENDARGRVAVKRWLKNRGCRVEDFFPFDVDLIVKRGDKWVCFVEVEVRGWNQCDYDTIHVAKRKQKLLDNGMPTYLFVCGNSLETGYFCDSRAVLASPIVTIDNKLMQGELFYDVPLDQFTQISLID